MSTPYLSIIIPAYNEARRLPRSLERLHNEYLDLVLFPYEIIIADDGSTDDLDKTIQAMDYDHVFYLKLPHKGKGHAVRQGMLHARGRWRVMCDADFSMPPRELKRLVPTPSTPSAPDILITSRRTLDTSVRSDPLRWLAGRVFNGLIRLITALPVEDTQCGFKCFSANSAFDLFNLATVDGFAFDIEILMLADQRGWSAGSLGVDWVHDGDSRVSLVRDSLIMLWDVVAIAQRLRREKRVGAEASTP